MGERAPAATLTPRPARWSQATAGRRRRGGADGCAGPPGARLRRSRDPADAPSGRARRTGMRCRAPRGRCLLTRRAAGGPRPGASRPHRGIVSHYSSYVMFSEPGPGGSGGGEAGLPKAGQRAPMPRVARRALLTARPGPRGRRECRRGAPTVRPGRSAEATGAGSALRRDLRGRQRVPSAPPRRAGARRRGPGIMSVARGAAPVVQRAANARLETVTPGPAGRPTDDHPAAEGGLPSHPSRMHPSPPPAAPPT